jgi:predicted  nucleic acid-binding Zn-ribbon protein
MGDEVGNQVAPRLELLHRVRCLGCGAVYAKPSGGGTATSNPGCPECGYVGWVLTSAPVTQPSLQHRSDADPLRRRLA